MTHIRLRYLLRPREVINRAHLPVLSVYRDYGVVPKDSRSDNYNKTPPDLTRYQEVRPGDLVFNKMKAWQGSVGVSGFLGIVSPDYLVCELSLAADPRYLHHLLRSTLMAANFAARSKGIRPSQWRLYWEELADIAFEVPPLDEQRRIATFLDCATSSIDSLIAARRRQVDVLDERYGSMVDVGIDGFSLVERVRLGYLASIQSGVTVDSGRIAGPDLVKRPYLRVANVQAGRLDLESVSEIVVARSTARASTLQAGDVLMTEGGDLDKLGRGTVWGGEIDQCLHQNHVFAVRPDRARLAPEYLSLLTQSSMARRYFESTGNKTTNLASTSSSKIRDFRVPLPDVASQKAFVREFGEQSAVIGNAKKYLMRQVRLLVERRQALITAAVTEQIDVSTASGVDV
jgi:type I restriction enzyme, S subunit